METTDEFWRFLDRLPTLLQQYSAYSYVLLVLLAVASLIVLGWHYRLVKTNGKGLSTLVLTTFAVLLFLAISGSILKYSAEVSNERQRDADVTRFLDDHRVDDSDHWIIVVDFASAMTNPNIDSSNNQVKMKLFVAGIKEVLLDDIPLDFRQPRIKLVPIENSPWPEGVDDNNFDDVITRLQVDELLWGVFNETGTNGKAFLALSMQLSATVGQDLGRQAPLHDLDFSTDLRRESLFNPDSYSRLIGMVMLGMALETVQRAEKEEGDKRRREFLTASKQLTAMRKKVSSSRQDPILRRTVYSSAIDDLIAKCELEAGGRS